MAIWLISFSLLKWVVVRWFLDVSSQLTSIRIIVFLETDAVVFGAENLTFGRPVVSTFAPWVTMGRSRGTWEHKKGGLGVQALIFIDFGWILGPHFESFSEIFDKLLCFCHACFQVIFADDFKV